MFVCVALHNFHANAASDDLPQSSFASCTPLPASLSSSLSPSLSCLFLFSALFTSTRSLSFFLSPLLVLFLLSRISIAFLFLLAFLAAQNFVIFVFVERLLKRNVCCASSTTSFSSSPSYSLPSTSWRRFWVNVCLLVVVAVAVVSCGIRVAAHRICASRRVDLCSIV